MKIKIIKYQDGEARVVLEGDTTTYCIKLDTINSKQELIDAILLELPQPDILEDKFNSLKLSELEGTNI